MIKQQDTDLELVSVLMSWSIKIMLNKFKKTPLKSVSHLSLFTSYILVWYKSITYEVLCDDKILCNIELFSEISLNIIYSSIKHRYI